jgi:hypothetical protein
MKQLSQILRPTILAIATFFVLPTGATPVQASAPQMLVVHDGQPVRLLAPGATFSVVTTALVAGHSSYCLGLISLRDRYGLPVNLGVFRPVADGLMSVYARVPLSVFPAEPPGTFLLFAGRCTTVAPDGIFASVTVRILPAAG